MTTKAAGGRRLTEAEWATIDSAPRDRTPVLVFDPSRPYSAEAPILAHWEPDAWDECEGRWKRLDRTGFIGMRVFPTHWLPVLPPRALQDRDGDRDG